MKFIQSSRWLTILIFAGILGLSNSLMGQSFQFSQFNASPLTLNPALTGRFADDFRLSGIYRSQWRGIGSTFETTNLGYDMNLKGGRLGKDVVGAGVYINQDNLGQKLMMFQTIMVSGAYHRFIDKGFRHQLSAGLQAGYLQRNVDFSQLNWESQYKDAELFPELGSGENFGSERSHTIHANLGFHWQFRINDKTRVHSGIAIYDILSTKDSFFDVGSASNTKARYVWNGGAVHFLNQQLSLMPELLIVSQAGGQVINGGMALGYTLGSKRDLTLFAGPWYRNKDAIIFVAGGHFKKFRLTGSYDHTVSNIRTVKQSFDLQSSGAVGAFEVSLIYTGRLKRPVVREITAPCGIF